MFLVLLLSELALLFQEPQNLVVNGSTQYSRVINYSFVEACFTIIECTGSPLFAPNVTRTCTESTYYQTILPHNSPEKVVSWSLIQVLSSKRMYSSKRDGCSFSGTARFRQRLMSVMLLCYGGPFAEGSRCGSQIGIKLCANVSVVQVQTSKCIVPYLSFLNIYPLIQ